MKGKSYMVIKRINEETGAEDRIEKLHKTIFDHREILSATVIEDVDTDEPDYIHIITKRGVTLDLEYEEDVYLDIAKYFRTQDLL